MAIQVVQRIERHDRAALRQHARLPEFPLEERHLGVAVAAHPVLRPAEGAAAMKDVPGIGIEIQARDPYSSPSGPAPCGSASR